MCAECPDCHGDGATYTQVRVGQSPTPFVCLLCEGDGDVPLAVTGQLPDGDPNVPCGRGPCCLGDHHHGECRQ